MDNYFSIKRFNLLLGNEILCHHKSWRVYLITILALYCGFAIFSVTNIKYDGKSIDGNAINSIFPGVLFIGGYIKTSLRFSDINDKYKSSLWFTTPGSTLEKYLVSLLISGVGYLLFISISFFIGSVISFIITKLVFGISMDLFYPFNDYFPPVIYIIFILTHVIFLVGSIVFKKAPLVKTILIISGVKFLLWAIIALIGFFVVDAEETLTIMYDKMESDTGYLPLIGGIILYLIFNYVGYIKLKNKDVKA